MKNFFQIISLFIIFFIINFKTFALSQEPDSTVSVKPESAKTLNLSNWKKDSENHFWHFKTQSKNQIPSQQKQNGFLRQSNDTSWLVIIIILGIMLIIIGRAIDPEDIPVLFMLLNNSLSRPKKKRDVGDELSLSSLLLTVNFILIFSAMLYFASEVFHFHVILGFAWYGIIVAFIAMGLLLRYLALKFIAAVFRFKLQFDFFIFQEMQYNRLLGIILIPVLLIAISYSGPSTLRVIVILFLGITLLLLAIRYFQGFMIGKEYIRYNTFHFLLYICTLEIAPLLIILKAIGNRVI
jgi:hypothetical protein